MCVQHRSCLVADSTHLTHPSTHPTPGQSKLQNRDQSWLRSIAAGGTMGDRLAAMMLRVQESPIHRLKELQQLLGIAQKKSKRESLLAIDTLRELWLSLLPDRKLRLFSQVRGRLQAGPFPRKSLTHLSDQLIAPSRALCAWRQRCRRRQAHAVGL